MQDSEIACCIFRCGVTKDSGEPIPPHLHREACEALVAQDAIWGCGGPFQFVRGSPCVVQVCDYI